MNDGSSEPKSANPSTPPSAATSDPFAPYAETARADDLRERRSRWRVVFPIISLAIGVFGMCFQGLFALQIVFWDAIMSSAGMTLTPPPDIIATVATAQIALTIPIGIVLIAGSAMLLLRKPLGAKLVMFWAVARLFLVVAGLVTAVITIKPQVEWGVTLAAEMRDEMRKKGVKEDDLPPLPDEAKAQSDGIRNMAIVSIATATWPFVMAIVLTRRHVREEVASWKQPTTTG
jgi:hypothetical protein